MNNQMINDTAAPEAPDTGSRTRKSGGNPLAPLPPRAVGNEEGAL
jgi:hypothetical protein